MPDDYGDRTEPTKTIHHLKANDLIIRANRWVKIFPPDICGWYAVILETGFVEAHCWEDGWHGGNMRSARSESPFGDKESAEAWAHEHAREYS